MFKNISIEEKLLYKSNCKMIKKMHGKNKISVKYLGEIWKERESSHFYSYLFFIFIY